MLQSSSGVARKTFEPEPVGHSLTALQAAEPQATPSIDNGYGSDNTKSLLPDAVQSVICANEDLTVRNGRELRQ